MLEVAPTEPILNQLDEVLASPDHFGLSSNSTASVAPTSLPMDNQRLSIFSSDMEQPNQNGGVATRFWRLRRYGCRSWPCAVMLCNTPGKSKRIIICSNTNKTHQDHGAFFRQRLSPKLHHNISTSFDKNLDLLATLKGILCLYGTLMPLLSCRLQTNSNFCPDVFATFGGCEPVS